MAVQDFRKFVPKVKHPRWGEVDIQNHDIDSWAEFGLGTPALKEMWATWNSLYREPYRGITAHGQQEANLFHLRAENAPTATMKIAATALLEAADAAGVTHKLRRGIDAPEWRCWCNPEFYFAKAGIRLEESTGTVVNAVLNLVKCSLSSSGYEKTLACMRINSFLGDLVNASHLMNEHSYNFLLFGEPSLADAWGWSLWGHHLTLCLFVVEGQMVVSPIFFGCEPNQIDSGPYKGTRILEDQMSLATRLFSSLSVAEVGSVVSYDALEHPDMPDGFPHPADGRTIAGAYQDNKVIPYSGGRVSTFSGESQELVLNLVESFIDFLPEGPLEAKLADVRHHISNTWLLWIGKGGETDVFYFRIHSPIIFCEFDHECGMWLTNPQPGRFHIHTIVRTPNGNDYGKELLCLWKAKHSEVYNI